LDRGSQAGNGLAIKHRDQNYGSSIYSQDHDICTAVLTTEVKMVRDNRDFYGHSRDVSYSDRTIGAPTALNDRESVLAELRQSMRQAAHDTHRLRNQVKWLTGIVCVGLLALAAALAGTVLNLRNNQLELEARQAQLAEQIQALETSGASTEQINQLQQQLASLSQQAQQLSQRTQSLAQEVPVSSEQLGEIQERLNLLEENVQPDAANPAVRDRANQ
jgi:chromosome segregation ATPase